MREPRGGGGRESRERGRWEVTVNTHARHYHHTINTVRHKHRRGVRRRAKTKTQEKQGGEGRGGEGVSWVGERQMGQQSQGSHFLLNIKFKEVSMNFKDSE